MKKFIHEFKEFALKGNVLDLAIAVIMGGAVGKVVTSLVDSILMPIVGILLGGKDFSKLGITVGSAVIKYGDFIQSVIDFLIISLFIFLMMKGINKLTTHIPKVEEEKEEEPEEVAPTTEELLLEIRDLLKEEQKK